MSRTAKLAFGLIGLTLVVFVVMISLAVMDAHKTVEKAAIPDTKKAVSVPKTARAEPSKDASDNRGALTKLKDSLAGLVAGRCSVRGKTIPLTEKWEEINPRLDDKHPPCRLVHEVFEGSPEYRDETGKIFPVGGWTKRDAVAVRAKPGTGKALYKYSKCPPGGSDKLDWDCRPQTKSAQR